MAYEQSEYLIGVFEDTAVDVLSEFEDIEFENYLHGYLLYNADLYTEGVRGDDITYIYERYCMIVKSFIRGCINQYQLYYA
jgi:hypothetical protein